MFGRVPGTRPNISESHSEISTRVPFCIVAGELSSRMVLFQPQALEARRAVIDYLSGSATSRGAPKLFDWEWETSQQSGAGGMAAMFVHVSAAVWQY